MFRTLLWSFKKSSRLQKIARKLTTKPDTSLVSSLAEGGLEAITPRLKEIKEGEKELFSLVREDPFTGKVLKDQGISDDDLDKLYWKLIRSGAGILKKGHWIAASALAYPQTLDYVLKHKGEEGEQFKKVCYRLWEYFSENQTGEIQE